MMELLKVDEQGVVAVAWDSTRKKAVILKKLPISERALLERDILAMLDHPAIPKLIDSYVDDNVLYVVMELKKGKTLGEFCRGHRLAERDVVYIVRQLVDVLSYLHDKMKIIHRDIKLENILIDDLRRISIIDFGFADHLKDGMTERLGSPAYCSPEIVTGDTYSATSDVWSLGVVTYYLLDGNLPFDGDTIDDVFEAICSSNPPIAEIAGVSADSKNFLSQVLRKDGKDRLNIQEVASHPWLTNKEPKRKLKCLSSTAGLTLLSGRNSLPVVKPRINNYPSVMVPRVRLA